MGHYRLKYLIAKLITKAIMVYPEHYFKQKKTPGKLINQLTKEDRKLIKTAKSSDFNNRIK